MSNSNIIVVVCIYALIYLNIIYTQDDTETIRCGLPEQNEPANPTIQCPIPGSSGIISITNGVSCSFVNNGQTDQLECGLDGKMTDIELGITPGQLEPYEYEFNILYPANIDGTESSDRNDCTYRDLGADRDEYPLGRCYVSKRVKLSVSSTKPLIGYSLNEKDLKIPSAYTSHHTDSLGTGEESSNSLYSDCRGDSIRMVPYARNVRFHQTYKVGTHFGFKVIQGRANPPDKNSESCRRVCINTNTDDIKCFGSGGEDDDLDGYEFYNSPFVTAYDFSKDNKGDPFLNDALLCQFCDPDSSGSDYITARAQSSASTFDQAPWCSLCTSYSKDYLGMTYFGARTCKNPVLTNLGCLDDNGNYDDDVTFSPCPLYEGWTTETKNTLIPFTCRINQCFVGNDEIEYYTPDTDRNDVIRQYCPRACQLKFSEFIDDKTPQRMWAGSYYNTGSVYKCIDDGGDIDDNDNTGFDQDCLEQFPNIFDAFDNCVTGRPPLYDDCDDGEDDGDRIRLGAVSGPERIFEYNPMIPAVNFLYSLIPSINGDKYPSKTVNNIYGRERKTRDDDDTAFCSVDDDFCVDGQLISKDENNENVIYVSRCPQCGCVTASDSSINANTNINTFNGIVEDLNDLIPDNFRCDDSQFGSDDESDSIRRRCNIPFPLYEDDGIEDDQMHPDDPFDYEPYPFNMCPLNGKDRTGIFQVGTAVNPEGQLLSFGFKSNPTGEAIGILKPYCTAYEIQPNPIPYYEINLTLESLEEDDDFPTQNVTLTNFQTGLQQSGTGVSKDGLLFASIDGIDLVNGKIGRELRGLIVICNAGSNITYSSPSSYNMGGNRQQGDPDFSKNFENPWQNIINQNIRGNSTLDTSNPNNVLNDLTGTSFNEIGALPPLPQMLKDLDLPTGSWWYYVNEQDSTTYGKGCKKIGMDPIGVGGDKPFFNDKAYAQEACNKQRHGCAPGFMEGEDFTFQQFAWDSDIVQTGDPFGNGFEDDEGKCGIMNKKCKVSGNQGLYQKYLKYRKIKEHTPLLVSSMFFDLLNINDCNTALEYLDEQGHLPPDYVTKRGDDPDGQLTCSAPRYFIQNNKLMFDAFDENTDDLYLRLRVAIPESQLLSVDTFVSTGQFINLDVSNLCSVQAQSDTGSFFYTIQNNGDTLGSYFVDGTCTEGVSIITPAQDTIVTNLSPGNESQPRPISISHIGNVNKDNTAQCDIILHPVALPEVILDRQTINCNIIRRNFTSIVDQAPTENDICTLYNIGCDSDVTNPPVSSGKKSVISILYALLTVFVFAVILITCFGCYRLCFRYEQEYRLSKAKI